MNTIDIIAKIFEIVIFPLLSVGTIYLINLIRVKNQELKNKQNNELFTQYSNMLEKTIIDCVLATTQTYVEALKKEGKFDKEAQKKAFNLTYENVMKILSKDAEAFLRSAIGDLEAHITEKIEAEVKKNKE